MQINFEPKNGLAVAKERLKENAKVQIKTGLEFLSAHNGLREAAQHLALGLSGGGKSTFFRTLMIDYQNNKGAGDKAGIWYSEEGENDFEVQFAKTSLAESFFLKKEINFYSEIDSWESKEKDFQKLELLFQQSDIIFFDNITTSSFYDGSYQEQIRFVKRLKSLVKKYEKPLVIFAHTDGKIKEGHKTLIEQNDIRGPKTVCNQSEFVYILQQFHTGAEIASTLRIVKHREQEVKNKIYSLIYDPKASVYGASTRLLFSQFKAIFDLRNRL